MTPRRTRSLLRADDGMSVIELVVASIIGLMVLTVAYLVFETGMKGFRQVENQTMASRTAAQAMLVLDRPIREASGFTTMTANDLSFLSDVNDDGVLEAVRFTIPSGTTNLQMTKVASGTVATVNVINDIRNLSMGVPLFTYFRDVGVPLTALQAGETTAGVVRIVRVSVVTRPNNQGPTPPSYTVQTDIYLRNKAQ